MKARNEHTAPSNAAVPSAPFALKLGELSIEQIVPDGLSVQLPVGLEGLRWVDVNGSRFFADPSDHETVRVAPVKYTNDHFREVIDMIEQRNYSTSAAINEVADKYGFAHESFKRQYYHRKGFKYRRIRE